jgi:hypothetical protein
VNIYPAYIGEGEILVPMEVFAGGLVELDVKGDIDTGKELAKDELAVDTELFLPVGVSPENRR